MKIIAFSDNHGYLPELEPCDVVCICGDIIPLEIQRDIFMSWWWFNNKFKEWAEKLDCKKVIFIAGNHDFFLEDEEPFEMGKVIYLKDSNYEYEGVTFYGSPWITGLPYWAFNVSETEQEELFKKIPDNVDFLLTHTPPFDMNDIGRVDFNQGNPIDFGSKALTKILSKDKNIRFALSGHIHSGNHNLTERNNIKLYNVSLNDESYDIYYNPLIINS